MQSIEHLEIEAMNVLARRKKEGIGRMRPGSKKIVIWAVRIGCVGAVIVIAGFLFTLSCIPTAGDHERVNLLLDEVIENYEFTSMRNDGRGPAVYCVGLAYSDHLSVYGNYSDDEVSEIRMVVSEAQERRERKVPIKVRFYSQELNHETLYNEVVIK